MLDNVKIPQNIRVEDKIVGPLSLRQILLIAGGGGLSYVFFTIVKQATGSIPILAHAFIWLPLVSCAAFALVRINDITLTRYLLLMLETISKPQIRPWLPRQGIIINIQTPSGKNTWKGGLLGWGKKRSADEGDGEVRKTPRASGKSSMVDLVHLLDEGGAMAQEPRPMILSLQGGESTAEQSGTPRPERDHTASLQRGADSSPTGGISDDLLDDALPNDPPTVVEGKVIASAPRAGDGAFPLDGVRGTDSLTPVHA